MATEIIMPKLGLTMTEGTVFEWHKKPGDKVKKGEIVATINSEKLTADVEAPADGILLEIIVPEGEDAKCQAPIAYLGQAGEQLPDKSTDKPAASESPQPSQPTEPAVKPASATATEKKTERIFITPLAKKIAAEKKIDYQQLKGTGGNGRITRRDVENYQPVSQTAVANQATVNIGAGLSGMRQIIAQRMMTSLQTTAQVTLQAKADISKLMQLKKTIKQNIQQPVTAGALSLTTLVSKAAVIALQTTPAMNAHYQAGKYEQLKDINLGLAVAVDNGLVVPVIKQAQLMGAGELGRQIARMVEQAQQGTLAATAYMGGTFTISNLGHNGIEYFTPVLNPPEVGILGVGSLLEVPALLDGKLVNQQKLPLSLTFDHQVIDGAPAAEFLAKIIAALEDPYCLLF